MTDRELAEKLREIAREGEKRVKENGRAAFPRPDSHIRKRIATLHLAADRLGDRDKP